MKIGATIIGEIKMTSFSTSYVLFLILVINIFNFQISLCDVIEDTKLIEGICRQVQDFNFCFNTFKQLLPDHPYVPEEVTRVAILQSIRNAKDNHAFILGSLAKATDKTVRDLYSICDTAYGLLVNELNVATQALPPKDFNDLENALTKCPRFVNDCQNVLGSNTTPEMLDRGRKQLNLVNMANIAEGLIQH